MATTRRGGWIAGTALLAVGILAAAWFLLASPRFDAAAQTLAQADANRSQNELMRAKITQLRADFERLPEYRVELAGLREQIPATAELSNYTRQLEGLAEAHRVTLVGVSPSPAQVVTLPTPVVVTAPVEGTPVEGEAGAQPDGTEGAPATTATTATPPAAQLEGFVAVPISLHIIGTYADVTAFLEAVQTGTDRLYLVTQLDGTSQDGADASGGKPATAPGDLELIVNGFAYVLVSPPAVPTDEEPVPSPLPSSDRNPFVPLG